MNHGAAAGVTFFGTADTSQKVTPITPEATAGAQPGFF